MSGRAEPSLMRVFAFGCAAAAALLISPLLATAFWLLWNWLAPIYLYSLPERYLSIPWWHCVGLFWLMPLVRMLIFPGLDIKVKEPK